jgi:hypothetical protein
MSAAILLCSALLCSSSSTSLPYIRDHHLQSVSTIAVVTFDSITTLSSVTNPLSEARETMTTPRYVVIDIGLLFHNVVFHRLTLRAHQMKRNSQHFSVTSNAIRGRQMDVSDCWTWVALAPVQYNARFSARRSLAHTTTHSYV